MGPIDWTVAFIFILAILAGVAEVIKLQLDPRKEENKKWRLWLCGFEGIALIMVVGSGISTHWKGLTQQKSAQLQQIEDANELKATREERNKAEDERKKAEDARKKADAVNVAAMSDAEKKDKLLESLQSKLNATETMAEIAAAKSEARHAELNAKLEKQEAAHDRFVADVKTSLADADFEKLRELVGEVVKRNEEEDRKDKEDEEEGIVRGNKTLVTFVFPFGTTFKPFPGEGPTPVLYIAEKGNAAVALARGTQVSWRDAGPVEGGVGLSLIIDEGVHKLTSRSIGAFDRFGKKTKLWFDGELRPNYEAFYSADGPKYVQVR